MCQIVPESPGLRHGVITQCHLDKESRRQFHKEKSTPDVLIEENAFGVSCQEVGKHSERYGCVLIAITVAKLNAKQVMRTVVSNGSQGCGAEREHGHLELSSGLGQTERSGKEPPRLQT